MLVSARDGLTQVGPQTTAFMKLNTHGELFISNIHSVLGSDKLIVYIPFLTICLYWLSFREDAPGVDGELTDDSFFNYKGTFSE